MIWQRKVICVLLSLLIFSFVANAQSTPYVLTKFPISIVSADSVVEIRWAGVSTDPMSDLPDSGRIFLSSSPGGSDIDNYNDSIDVFYIDSSSGDTINNKGYESGTLAERAIEFIPSQQENMEAGKYYFMIAWRQDLNGDKVPDTVWYSNEMQIVIESDSAPAPISPKGAISNLTPTFKWSSVPGVPYYHLLLSDSQIVLDNEAESIDVAGLSVIWQVITPYTQINYGAPDPSGTINAEAPPMSPGQTYNWLVLNNYGNRMAYTSHSTFQIPPGSYTVEGESLKKPVCVSPLSGDTILEGAGSSLSLKWTNLDESANTYHLYIYKGAELGDISAKMVIWDREYTAGKFAGDTAEVEIDAGSILATSQYFWRAIAVDSRGAGSGGDYAKFYYDGAAAGYMKIYTKEEIRIDSATTVESGISAVKLEVEVIEGSMEETVLFYTDNNGVLTADRGERTVGQYRITASKEGFEDAVKTITVEEGDTSETTFYLERPDATVYGFTKDSYGNAINIAKIYGVSGFNDTVVTESDPDGNFVLNCSAADWKIWAEKTGYISSLSIDTTVKAGTGINMGTFTLKKNPYILSGSVINSEGTPLIGVNVKVFREGVLISENPSTSQEGSFSFQLESGEYRLTANKTGFISYSDSLKILNTQSVSIEMSAGAAQIEGEIIGRTWAHSGWVYAPVSNAAVSFVDTSSGDTITVKSDKVYGDYEVSLSGGRSYLIQSSASGYRGHSVYSGIIASGSSKTVNDTLLRQGSVNGLALDTAGNVLSGVTVQLVDTVSGKSIVSGTSDKAGLFEIYEIPDGVYSIVTGKSGFIYSGATLIDTGGTSLQSDTISVDSGRVMNENADGIFIDSILVSLEEGNKSIRWFTVHNYKLVSAQVKLLSPLVKTLSSEDTLTGAGELDYKISVDADSDSIIDLSEYKMNLPDSTEGAFNDSMLFIDSVIMRASHVSKNKMAMDENGNIEMNIKVYDSNLDSGFVYYKDINSSKYNRESLVIADTLRGIRRYTVSFSPPKNGSNMNYYFRLFHKNSVFGYDKEIYTSYIELDTVTLTMIEISPSEEQTMLFPPGSDLEFSFRGYFGSNYSPDSNISGDVISWSLLNKNGCSLNKKTGLKVVLSTPSEGVSDIVTIKAAIDTTKRRIISSVDNSVSVDFKVSENPLDSLKVIWTNETGEGYINTGKSDYALFSAEGVDSDGESVVITPVWSVLPAGAGTITEQGSFIPSENFAGYARIIAQTGDIVGKFNALSGKDAGLSGLQVKYIIPFGQGDAATNYNGCSIIFPDSIIDEDVTAELSISSPVLQNRIELDTRIENKEYSVAGDVYEIDLNTNKAGFQFNTADAGSIEVMLEIPDFAREDALSDDEKVLVGRWNSDSLRWNSLENYSISEDGKTVTVKAAHFSRYAVLLQKEDKKPVWNIKPNPFSPYVKPTAEYGIDAQNGVCIEVTPKFTHSSTKIRIYIYNVVGNTVLVADVDQTQANNTYQLWWDGKTNGTDKAEVVELIEDKIFKISGSKMCRNGRYFIVLSLTDANGNEKKYMKPVVLIK